MTKLKSEFVKKFLESVILISGAVWLGSQITKILTIYYFFQTDRFGRITIKNEILPDTINLISYQLVPIFSVSLISYILFILFTIFYFILMIKNLKKVGWLFISFIIIFLCSPFEVYLSLIDIELLRDLFYRTGESSVILSLFEKRIMTLSSFPIMSIILHTLVFFLIVFKPLDKREVIEN